MCPSLKNLKPEPKPEEEIPPPHSQEYAEFLQKRLSGHKSFEMEDIPDENPIKCHPEGRAQRPKRNAYRRRSQQLEPKKTKFDYPIVRHHPLFAKQHRRGERSNFSSLLLGQNVRVIRRQKGSRDNGNEKSFDIFNPETDDLDSDDGIGSDSSDDSSASTSKSSSSSPDSNDSVESVVSARTDDTLHPSTAATGASPVGQKTSSSATSPATGSDEKPEEPEVGPVKSKEDKIQHSHSLEESSRVDVDHFAARSEKRRRSLMNLLGENQNVILSIRAGMTQSGSNNSLKTDSEKSGGKLSKIQEQGSEELEKTTTKTETKVVKPDDDDTVGRLTGAKPKKPPDAVPKKKPVVPAIVVPPPGLVKPLRPATRGRLDKARSVSPSSGHEKVVSRQLSVPSRFEETFVFSTTDQLKHKRSPESQSRSRASSGKTSPNTSSPSASPRSSKDKAKLLEVSPTPSDGLLQSSRESLYGGSLDSCSERLGDKSKTPSPSRSETSVSSGQRKPGMVKASKIDDPESLLETDLPDLKSADGIQASDSESTALSGGHHGVPFRRLDSKPSKLPARDDSVESNTTKHSETSSLLSHRFSTISISSNVSSSDISFGNTSGSSCYLASMSSADFDDGGNPRVLASSFSLSEADETEYLAGHAVEPPALPPPAQRQRTFQEKMRMRSLFRRTPQIHNVPAVPTVEPPDDDKLLSAPQDDVDLQLTDSVPPSPGVLTVIERKPHPRSRIGTETSLDTSIDNPTCIDRGVSFEEELFRGLSRENNDEDDDEVEEEFVGHVTAGNSGGSGAGTLGQLSAASSQDSLHSDNGGSLTNLRYYHVFREGELDYLINHYVENLHIISSYYDHSNWCIVAEKVNVWTL